MSRDRNIPMSQDTLCTCPEPAHSLAHGSVPRLVRDGEQLFSGAETCAKERAVTTIKDSKPCDAVALVVSKP